VDPELVHSLNTKMGKRAAKSESSDSESSDEEAPAKVEAKNDSGSDSSSDEEEEDKKVTQGSPKKAKTDSMVAGGGAGRKLFVGGISFDTEEDGLRAFFKDCGEIEDLHMPVHADTGYKRGFAFVTFADAAGATAGAALNDGELDGRWLNIRVAEDKVAREDAGAGEPQLKVFVGGLNYETDEEGVKKFFADCGETTDVYFPTDRETGNYRGALTTTHTTHPP